MFCASCGAKVENEKASKIKGAFTSSSSKIALIKSFDSVLGLNLAKAFEEKKEIVEEINIDAETKQYVEKMIEERKIAKLEKNYERADEIRNELASKGIELIDTKDGTTFNWKVIADANNYAPSMKYAAFIGADQPYSVIENLDNADGETCLVIKDSFGNAFIPFLIPHYKTIHIIDPRYYESTLSEFSENKKLDDIIFISNISTTRNDVFIGAMERFIK